MSVDYNFNINIIKRGISKFTAKDVIKCYLNAGWTLYSERNQVIYTGIGDIEEFDFCRKKNKIKRLSRLHCFV